MRRLYFEPLTFEDVMHIVEKERPDGVIVQFGGQTPLNLAVPLLRAGVPILGTSPDAIDRAEDRERFQALLQKLSLLQPANGTATTLEESREIAHRIGYPIVIRPSYVLGGRAMMIVYDDEEMAEYFALHVGKQKLEHPVLIDKFLENAIEVDVDALSDGVDVYVAGVMEHIEEAGIHSGDSSCVLPPYSLPAETVAEIERQTVALAKELRVSVLTVTRAYNELADEGLVENVQGKGTFVMERGNELMKERARERIMDKLREVSIEAKAADISLLDLLGMFEKAYREQS